MLSEITMMVPEHTKYKPSLLASAIIALSSRLLGGSEHWTMEMEEITGYSITDFKECTPLLIGLIKMVNQEWNKTPEKKQLVYIVRKYKAASKVGVADVILNLKQYDTNE